MMFRFRPFVRGDALNDDEFRDGRGRPWGGSVTKRDFLFLMTGSLAAVGAAATAWPFIDQMNPDAATIAAAGPVDIDIQQLQPGQRIVALWAARPVFVVKRDQPPSTSSRTRSCSTACATPAHKSRSSRPTPPTGAVRSSPRFW